MDRWKSDAFKNIDLAELIGKDLKERLQIRPHPHFGWRSLPNQKLETISINEHGLRGPSINSAGSNVCLLLGGSFAWGFGASSNASIPAKLIQNNLNKTDDTEYTLINLADQMFCSIEEIKSFIFSVDELNPKMVLVLTGYNDIARSYNKIIKVTNHEKREIDFFHWGLRNGLIYQSSRFKALARLLLDFRNSNNRKFFSDNYFIFNNKGNSPINAFKHKVDVLTSYCLAKGIKIAFFLQPHLLLKKNKSNYEKEYMDFLVNNDQQNVDYLIGNYNSLALFIKDNSLSSQNILFSDTTTYFDEIHETVFFDSAHITDFGYKIYCKKIYEEIYNWSAITA